MDVEMDRMLSKMSEIDDYQMAEEGDVACLVEYLTNKIGLPPLLRLLDQARCLVDLYPDAADVADDLAVTSQSAIDEMRRLYEELEEK